MKKEMTCTYKGVTTKKMVEVPEQRVTWEEMGRPNCASQYFRPKKGKGSYNRQKAKLDLQRSL